MEITTVPVHYLKAVLASARRNGCDTQVLLEAAGIASELLDSPKARIPVESFTLFTNAVRDELKDEHLGFMGRPSPPGTFAMMNYACIHCPTLGQYLNRSLQFYNSVVGNYEVLLTTEGDISCLKFLPQSELVDPSHFTPQTSMGLVHRIFCWLIGQNLNLHSVSLIHRRPEHAHDYNMLFRAPIQFDQDFNALYFSASYLNAPNVQDESALEKLLELPSLQLMSLPDYQSSLADKIRVMIKKDVETQFPELEPVAEALGLSSATLRRRLRSDGTSYQIIKDDIRRDAAIYHLGRGVMSIEQVAAKVGFIEVTSFYRAFKRWTGVTPRDYIKKTPAG